MVAGDEASKKRNSFSLLSRKEPAASSSKLESEEPVLANSKFIPESKRGWKYDMPFARPPPIDSNAASKSTANVALTGSALDDGSDLLAPPPSGDTARGARSAPVSPKRRTIRIESGTSSDSSWADEQDHSSSEEDGSQARVPEARRGSAPNGKTGLVKQHPDDLVYPDSYPWKPSLKNPDAKYVNPAIRNATAKQAFYDTHFGSSSSYQNYRGLLPASAGSFLGLNLGYGKASSRRASTDRRRSSDKGDMLDHPPEEPESSQGYGLVSTIKKPFNTASKLITKARRKSVAGPPQNAESATDTDATAPERPQPVPLFDGSGDGIAASRSGFSYGMSLEDAAQVESIVSRQSTQQDLTALEPSSPGVPASGWKETMQSVWGFLPSFGFLGPSSIFGEAEASSKAPAASVNLLEAELIPSITKDPGSPNYYKNLSGNVVIFGGYRGSVLRDAETNMMMWIPIKVGVGLRRPTLELGLSSAAEEKSEELVYSSEMCTHIGKLVDMGKRLEERVASRRHAKVHAWGYDWRLSLARSSRKLTAFLEELYEASADANGGKKRGANVVAHSMGGLVALHALATCKNPRIFEGLVFASTPFCGTPNILGPFRFGDAALFNDTICSPRATFSFRSSFYLLPTDKRCFEIPVGDPEQDEEDLTEQQKKERFKDVDFLDPNVWNELGLSPCLEVGRRQEVLAIARKTASEGKKGGSETAKLADDANDPAELEQEASKVVRRNSANSGSILHSVTSPQSESEGNAKGLTMGLMEGLTDGSPTSPNQADPEPSSAEQEMLQPENREGASRNARSDSVGQTADEIDFNSLDYSAQSWLYLERTLSEVRQFWSDIENGFSSTHFASGAYPPLMLLTSGRTPCVRGALVGVDAAYGTGDNTTGQRGWKDDVRAGDYSRMTYGAGDGVITRRSATSLPGKWASLLTKREEAELLPEEYHGKGPPWSSKPSKETSKGRLKMDKYRMRFDGEGIVESAHRHVTLLSDVDGIGKCLEAVRRANLVRGRLPLTQPASSTPSS